MNDGGYMKRGAILFVILLAATLQACEPPQRSTASTQPLPLSDNLGVVIADVMSTDSRSLKGDMSGVRALPHNIAVLTRAIDGGGVEKDALRTLHYYRGVARQSLNAENLERDLPVDRQVAEGAVSDFRTVLAGLAEDPEKLKFRSNVLYRLGQVTSMQLKDDVQAYRYFRECSDMKHAACQNVMAEAMLTGDDGVEQDIKGALALHKAVYETGLTYTCAGSFSARTIAMIVHFTGERLDDRTGLDWLRRSSSLADQVRSLSDGVDVCSGDYRRVEEYLMRLDAGDRQESLIADFRKPNDVLQSDAAKYLLGDMDEKTYLSGLKSIKDTGAKCSYAFLGVWKSSAQGNKDAAREYRAIMEEGRTAEDTMCPQSIVFADYLLN